MDGLEIRTTENYDNQRGPTPRAGSLGEITPFFLASAIQPSRSFQWKPSQASGPICVLLYKERWLRTGHVYAHVRQLDPLSAVTGGKRKQPCSYADGTLEKDHTNTMVRGQYRMPTSAEGRKKMWEGKAACWHGDQERLH